MISDYQAFLENYTDLNIHTQKGDMVFHIALNVPTGTFYKWVAQFELMNRVSDDLSMFGIVLSIVADILQSDNEKCNADWIMENIPTEYIYEIVTKVITAIQELIQNEVFMIPEIKVDKKEKSTDKANKVRIEKRRQIEKLENELTGKVDGNLMNDIALVSEKTANNYFDIMKMPILAFRDLVRTVTIRELRTDDDYNLAYLRDEKRKITDKLNDEASGKPHTSTKKKGGNLKGLKAMLG